MKRKRTLIIILIFLNFCNPSLILAKNYMMNEAIQMGLKGRIEEAKSIFKQIIGREPNNAFAYNNLGKLYIDQGNLKEAIIYLEKAVKINPVFSLETGFNEACLS